MLLLLGPLLHTWVGITGMRLITGRHKIGAKELYCAAHPNDLVCTPFTGGQCEGVGYEYGWEAEFVRSDGQSYGYSGSTAGQLYWSYAVWGQIKGIRAVGNTIEVLARGRYGGQFMPDFVWVSSYSTGNNTTLRNARFRNIVRWDRSADNCGNPPPLPWKDWPQAKRDAAVALLNNSDWQRLITSMPFGGTLDPGDIAIAPKIVIPGQEWDNPNTPLDDRRLKTVPGEYARPVVPDFDHDSDPDETDADDDNDGIVDPYDPEPRNSYVPRASSEPPPPPDDDTPPQSEGERAVSDVSQSYGDFLEKAENDAF